MANSKGIAIIVHYSNEGLNSVSHGTEEPGQGMEYHLPFRLHVSTGEGCLTMLKPGALFDRQIDEGLGPADSLDVTYFGA